MSLFVKLAAIETKYEQTQCAFEGEWARRKATGAACEPSKIMSTFSIISFDRKGLRFVGQSLMLTGKVDKSLIGRELVAVVPLSLRTAIQHGLKHRLRPLNDNLPGNNAARGAVNKGYDVDFVFFSRMKVNSSSISSVSTRSGRAGGGNWATWALTQLATLWGLTPNKRPTRRKLIPSRYIRTAASRIRLS